MGEPSFLEKLIHGLKVFKLYAALLLISLGGVTGSYFTCMLIIDEIFLARMLTASRSPGKQCWHDHHTGRIPEFESEPAEFASFLGCGRSVDGPASFLLGTGTFVTPK